ncbi:unnamed protein product [Closterium sp. Yama58-4]|nr:unnamed protein product [Closterium sp. Yama58-4]
MTADVKSSHCLFPLLSMAHSTPVPADLGASAFAASSLRSTATLPSEPLREEGVDRLQSVRPFDLSLPSHNSFLTSQAARSSIVASAINAAATATDSAKLANQQHFLQPSPCLPSPVDVSLPIAIPSALRGTAVVAVTGAGIEANALSPHSTLSGGITHKLFLSTQSFRSFPPNLPLSALGSCSSSGSSGSSSPCGGTGDRGSQSLSVKRQGSENLLKRINFSMSMPNLNGWLRNKDRRFDEGGAGGSAHGPDEGSDLSAIFEVPQSAAQSAERNAERNAVQNAVQIAVQNVDAGQTGITLSRSHKEPVREVSWTGSVVVTEDEETTARSPGESSRGKWRITRSSRSHREHHSRTGWAAIGDKIRLSSLSSSRLLPSSRRNFLRNSPGSMNAISLTGPLGPAGGEDLISMSLGQSCGAPAPGNPQMPAGGAAEAAVAEGARDGQGADCEGGEPELLGLEAEEGIVVSWSLNNDAAARGNGGATCAAAEGAEWAEGVAGEDRMQVVASGNGYVFSAVYDGFTDTSAADFLVANLHSRFAQQLVARGLDFGEANSNTSLATEGGDHGKVADASRRHEMVLQALAAALSETEAAYFESLEERIAERLELAVAGACLVVAVVAGRELYVMNLGDCRAVVVAEDGQAEEAGEAGEMGEVAEAEGEGRKKVGELRATQLTEDHNMNNEKEVERLRRERADDPDAITKMRVKGKLKATRAFGAAYLKNPRVNAMLLGMLRVQYVGSQPYISSSPHLHHLTLSPSDRYLVLSSDGLYQHMTPADAAASVSRALASADKASGAGGAGAEGGCGGSCKGACGPNLSHVLVQEALDRAARRAGMTIEQLLQIRAGDYRRQLHDDLSVTVLELQC